MVNQTVGFNSTDLLSDSRENTLTFTILLAYILSLLLVCLVVGIWVFCLQIHSRTSSSNMHQSPSDNAEDGGNLVQQPPPPVAAPGAIEDLDPMAILCNEIINLSNLGNNGAVSSGMMSTSNVDTCPPPLQPMGPYSFLS